MYLPLFALRKHIMSLRFAGGGIIADEQQLAERLHTEVGATSLIALSHSYSTYTNYTNRKNFGSSSEASEAEVDKPFFCGGVIDGEATYACSYQMMGRHAGIRLGYLPWSVSSTQDSSLQHGFVFTVCCCL